MRTTAFALLVFLAGAAPALAQKPRSAQPAPAVAAQAPQAPAATPAERVGGENARVVIEEYADFECPYCGLHEVQYGDSVLAWVRAQQGAVRFDFYDVALRYHAAAAPAAHAARCAGEQQQYHAAKHAIFAAQKEWAETWDAVQRVTAIARATVADGAAFDRCMTADASALYGILGANLERGRALGIPGTPTFVIRVGERQAQIVDPASPDSIAKVVRSLEPPR